MYVLTTERLGFRNWKESDISKLHSLNSDKEVMAFFPSIYSEEETHAFVKRMQKQYKEKGYCYFAVELLATQKFIGFIGLSYQTYQANFTPCIDIGWRLAKKHWNNGYASEGAKACLQFAFQQLKLETVLSIASVINTKSIAVMAKIGMSKITEFEHPLLLENKALKKCVLYQVKKEAFTK